MKNRRTINEYSGIQRALAAVVAWAYILCLCPPASAQEAVRKPSGRQSSAELISAEHGGTVRLGRASIEIPAGALESDTEISITRLGRVAGSDGTLRNATEGGGGYRFLPAGQKFKKEVFITIPYESAGTDLISTYYYDTNVNQWCELESVCLDRNNRLATCASTHFTDMINATLALPDTASPLELNINSIKGLEAADPLGGMIKMEAPQAGASGDASFSLPLQIPAGRHGMQPALSVCYSSGGGNGVMGKGFYLHCTSTITTDTRVGLPKYDGHDVYLKDGAELSLYDEFGGDQEYTALSEAAFEKTVRHDVSGDDWWEVTSKDGIVRLYGMRSDGKADVTSRSRYAHDGKYSTYTWNLTEEKDVYGNSISYHYNNDGEIPYLTEINYTGMNGSGGAYTVRLTYDRNSRRDILLNSRGRFLTRQAWRLSAIEALSSDTVLRKYEFSYGDGISGSSLLKKFTVKNGVGQSYSYTFDYKGILRDSFGKNAWFAEAEIWECGRPLQEGSSFSSGHSINGSLGIGLGTEEADVRITGGAQGADSSTTGYTERTLADMDGDGRADAVYQSGSSLLIYRNNGAGFDGSPVTVDIGGAPRIDLEEGSSSSTSWNVYGGAGIKSPVVGIDLGVSYAEAVQDGSSSIKSTLSDVDGDGRTDILISGRDTYLHNEGIDRSGKIHFSTKLLHIAGELSNTHRTLSPERIQKYKETYYAQTPFRSWVAPYEGTVLIKEKITMTHSDTRVDNPVGETFLGNSTSPEVDLRVETGISGSSASSAEKSVTAGESIYFITDNGDDPKDSDVSWNIRIEYNSMKAFAPKGLPLAVNTKSKNFIESLEFIPGRLTEAQMSQLIKAVYGRVKSVTAAENNIRKARGEKTVTENEVLGRLTGFYLYDRASGMFILRDGLTAQSCTDIYNSFLMNDGGSVDNVKIDSLNNYALWGMMPEWDEYGIHYRSRDSGCRITKNILTGEIAFGTIGGKTVRADSDGKVFVNGNADNGYSVRTDDENIVLKGKGYSISYGSGETVITYNTDTSYPVSGGKFLMPVFSGGEIILTGKIIEKWDSGKDFSTENFSESYSLHEEESGLDTEIMPLIPLYGGSKGWYYGIWIRSLSENPFCGSAVTGIYDRGNMTAYNAEQLKNRLSARKGKDGKDTYDLDVLKSESSKNSIRWYTASKGNNEVSGTVTQVPVQFMTTDGNVATRTDFYRPYINGDLIHSDRAGGDSFYKIEGINQGNDGVSYVGTATIPDIRRSWSSGTDITMSAGPSIGLSGGQGDGGYDVNTGSGNAGLGLSLNSSSNTSDNTVTQSIQDVTGDGIPDIISLTGEYLLVVPGSRERDSWEVTFDTSRTLSLDVQNVSFSSTRAAVSGGSMNASGSVSVKYDASNRHSMVIPSASGSMGFSGGVTRSEGIMQQHTGFIDINGDGIADYFNRGSFRLGNGTDLNAGNGYFSGLDVLTESENQSYGDNFSASAGIGIGAVSEFTEVLVKASGVVEKERTDSLMTAPNGGLGASRSTSVSNTTKMLLDINGDGLPDIVSRDGGGASVKVRYNLGSSFAPQTEITIPSWGEHTPRAGNDPSMDFADGINAFGGAGRSAAEHERSSDAPSYIESLDWTQSETVSVSGNIGINVNISITIPLTPLSFNFTTNVGGAVDSSSTQTSTEVRMIDMDGDGLPDQVMHVNGVGTYVKRNLMGTADYVSSVNFPWGGQCRLDYGLVLGTCDNPYGRYAMTECVMDDGLSEVLEGMHSVRTRYAYDGGFYDRLHKDSYGYGSVDSIKDDGSFVRTEYYTDSYYSRYLPKKSFTYGRRNPDCEVELLGMSVTDLRNAPYAQPVREESVQYGTSGGTASVRTEYSYGEYGNVTKIVQSQLRNGTADDVMTLTAEIDWDDSKSRYLHSLPKSITVCGGDGTMLRKRTGSYDEYGALTSLSQYHKEGEAAGHSFTYDSYGNMTSVTDGLGISTEYTYDRQLHQYMLKTVRSGGGISYTSSAEWNTVTGTKTSETDINGNKMSYTYDGWQRVATVRSPYDSGIIPAVSYSYGIDGAGRWYAVTDNKVSFNASDKNVIKTVIQADGLGRALRTAKTGVVYDRSTDSKKTGWNVAGTVEYDAMGRVVRQGQPYFIEGNLSALSLAAGSVTAEMLRPTLTEYDSLDRVIKTTLPDGSVQTAEYDVTASGEPYTKTTDTLGNKSVQRTDPAGNIIYVERLDSGEASLTSATYTYNAMGEMLKATDVKGNDITASYDLLGRRLSLESIDGGKRRYEYDAYRLLREDSGNLRENGQWIGYEYDALNRLVKVDYPTTADTVYSYGASGAENNTAGKITKLTDASGTITYKYGKLGETVEENRTLAVKNGTDGETLTATTDYTSNYLGQMEQIAYPDGEKVDYGYDAGGQVTSVIGSHYGHDFVYVSDIGYDEFGQRVYIKYGTGVRTDYEYDENRRWLSRIGTAKGQKKFQNISYSFDLVGNVLGYTNDCTSGGGYTTSQTYSYDSLYQLISASGSTRYEPVVGGVVPEHESTYTQNYSFDILGNMTTKTSSETVYPEKKIGDALNYSLDFSYAEGFAHRLDHAGQRYYSYDADGNVVCERNGEMSDGGSTGTGDDDEWDDWDDDWGEGLGESGFGFGMGGSGTGAGGNVGGNGGQSTVYERIYTWDERDRLAGTTEGEKVVGYVYGEDGKRTNKYSSAGESIYFSDLWSWHEGGSIGTGGQTTKNIYLGTERIVSKLNRGKGLDTYSEEYHKTYYWHSDHLGSAHFITDYQGNEYQRIEYTPYGEEWVELESDSGELYLPYKFTGKERDEETGLYYYGARYLDPVYSRWLSTDPAVGEYVPAAGEDNLNLPGMGGIFNVTNLHLYNYCSNNPVRYIDPDGTDVGNATKDYILARLETPLGTDAKIPTKIPLLNKDTGLPMLDENGNQLYIKKIDTLVLKPGEIVSGEFDGTRDKSGNYCKVTARKEKVDFTVMTGDMKIWKGSKLRNFGGDILKIGANLFGADKILSGFSPKDSKKAKKLSKAWDEDFNNDVELDSDWSEAYDTNEQYSLRVFLNKNETGDR